MLPMMSATGEIGIVISLSVWLGFLILSVYVASSCLLTASTMIFQTHLDLLIRWKKEKKKKEKRKKGNSGRLEKNIKKFNFILFLLL